MASASQEEKLRLGETSAPTSAPTSPRVSEASTSAYLSETSDSAVGVQDGERYLGPLAKIRQQLEYYFSEENLAYDEFFHKKLSASGGMLDLNHILRCNRMQALGANEQHIRAALVGSDFEFARDGSAVGKPGMQLPRLLGSAENRPHNSAKAPPWSKQEIETASVPEMLEMVAYHGVLRSSQHPQGCWVVQRLLEESNTRGCQAIFARLCGHMWDLVQCRNGHHVVQKCIVHIPGVATRIVQELMRRGPGSAKKLAQHFFGCRVFQRLLEHGSLSDQVRLHDDAWWYASVLCKNQNATYVMQKVFEQCQGDFGDFPRRDHLVAEIANSAAHMCCSLHGAVLLGVVFRYGRPFEQQTVAKALLNSGTKWRTRQARKEYITDAVDRFL